MRLEEKRRKLPETTKMDLDSSQPNGSPSRDVEWSKELKSRLAAVQAWRGHPIHHTPLYPKN